MKKLSMTMIVCLLLVQVAMAEGQNVPKREDTSPAGEPITPMEFLATFIGLALVFKLFGVKTKPAKPKSQPSLAAQLKNAVGPLETIDEGTQFGTTLLEESGDVKVYGSIAQVDLTNLRKEVEAKANRKLKLMFWGFLTLTVLVLVLSALKQL